MKHSPFSLQGRIKRLPYFLWCLTLSVTFAVVLFSLFTSPAIDQVMGSAAPKGYDSSADMVGQLGSGSLLMLLASLLIYGWMSLVLLWKRTRDMNGNMTFAYAYVGLFFSVFIPVLGAISGFLIMGMNMILLFKPSTELTPNSAGPEVFGDLKDADQHIEWPKTGNATLGSDAELVARAAKLRNEQEAPKAADSPPPIRQPSNRGSKSFGRRTGALGT